LTGRDPLISFVKPFSQQSAVYPSLQSMYLVMIPYHYLRVRLPVVIVKKGIGFQALCDKSAGRGSFFLTRLGLLPSIASAIRYRGRFRRRLVRHPVKFFRRMALIEPVRDILDILALLLTHA